MTDKSPLKSVFNKTGKMIYSSNGEDNTSYNFFRHNNIAKLQDLVTINGTSYPVTKTAICFSGISFGVGTAVVIENLGEPKGIIENNENIEGHKILYYKAKVGPYPAKCQIHFLENAFFYASFNFTRSQKKVISNLKEALAVKYLNKDDKTIFHSCMDQEQNRITVEEGAFFSIHYITGNVIIKEKIDKLLSVRTLQRQKAHRNKIEALIQTL